MKTDVLNVCSVSGLEMNPNCVAGKGSSLGFDWNLDTLNI